MRKHTDGDGWECLWCGFNIITANHTKALSRVTKVKIIVFKIYLCVAMILNYRLARHQALQNKTRVKNSANKRTQEQVNQDINELQETSSKVLSAKKYQSILLHPGSFPPSPCSFTITHFKLFFWKNPRLSTRP